MAGSTVVVLGGGTGGVVAANELRRRLGREHRVILVDREGSHVFWPSLLWLQVGLRKPDSIVRDLANLEKKGIQVIKEPVEAIDPARKTVRLPSREIEADQMVISLGADLAPEKVPGLAEAGHNLYTLAGATAVRDTRRQLTSGSLAVVVASTPFKCPAAPCPRPAFSPTTRPRWWRQASRPGSPAPDRLQPSTATGNVSSKWAVARPVSAGETFTPNLTPSSNCTNQAGIGMRPKCYLKKIGSGAGCNAAGNDEGVAVPEVLNGTATEYFGRR